MISEIRQRIEQINNGIIPNGYKKRRWILYLSNWNCVRLNTCLFENKKRNKDGIYTKDDVLSVSGESGVVNQIEFMGRSYAGESVLPYHIVETGDIVYTKSPLKQNPYGIIKLNRGKPGIVSTLYAVYHCNNPITAEYLNYFFEIDEYLNSYLFPLVKKGAKNDMKVNNEDVIKGEIALPSIEEQEKIVKILKQCDKVIELYQKEIDELQKLKKAYLRKMFPQKGSKVPELRFVGFTDAWEQRKLGEVLVSLQNNTLSRAELSTDKGVAKDVHYGDILVKFGEVLDISKEQLPMIVNNTIVEKYKTSFLQDGDVIVADTAEDVTVGKCTEIVGLGSETVISGLHTIPYRPLFNFASGYLGYYMNSPAYHSQLLPFMQGIKVTSISKSDMKNTGIVYPKTVDEQKQIGEYFRNFDNLITLHQRKLDEQKKQKKALMQLLLTGIVRVQ